MSQTKVQKLHKVSPILIKKNALKINRSSCDYDFLLRCVKKSPQLLIKEDVIYRSTDDDFLKGKYPKLVLVNKMNVVQNTSRTIATYDHNSVSVKLTSDAIVRVIGQKNYDIVFNALCSIISLESRVLGILSLLSSDKLKETASTATQTTESCRDVLKKHKVQRNKRSKVSPYVITDHLMESDKREITNDVELIQESEIKVEHRSKNVRDDKAIDTNDKETGFPELKQIVNEDSNISDSSIGNLSLNSCHIPGIIENTKTLLNYIEDHTVPQFGDKLITMMDGTKLLLKGNPDDLHLVTSETVKDLSPIQTRKLLWHQAYIDWKLCLQRDEDGNLPLHWAVLHDDVDLLRRQCLVLKSRQESVDIPAGNMTALQMSIADASAKCTELLLMHGADALAADEEARTALHLAAERGEQHTAVVLQHCRSNARSILNENEELGGAGFEDRPDSDLGEYLINKISVMCDDRGYTPLMLASKAGDQACVRLLLRAAPYTVNTAMPTCGNTALYLTVTEACVDANNSDNKSKIDDKFMKTIECLVENGADPSIVNSYGSSVNDLLNEFNFTDLSMMIANKLTSVKYLGGGSLDNFTSYMLIRNACGEINLTRLKEPLKIHEKPTKTYGKRPIDDEMASDAPAELMQTDTQTNGKTKRQKNMKCNTRIDIRDVKIVETNKDFPTIYKTLPVVKIVSKMAKDLVILSRNNENVRNERMDVKKVNVVSKPMRSSPIKILPKLGDRIKISSVAVKRAVEPRGGGSGKRNKNSV